MFCAPEVPRSWSRTRVSYLGFFGSGEAYVSKSLALFSGVAVLVGGIVGVEFDCWGLGSSNTHSLTKAKPLANACGDFR